MADGLKIRGRQVAAPTGGWLWPFVGDDGNRPVVFLPLALFYKEGGTRSVTGVLNPPGSIKSANFSWKY